MSVLQGGRFGHGFASAAVVKALTLGTRGLNLGDGGRFMAATLGGGTGSVITGVKFANGAATAALAFAANDLATTRCANTQKQKFPKIKELWEAYPEGENDQNARPSSDSYAVNQCAIRTGVALDGAGMDISGYPAVNQTSEGWPRSSKGLADGLWNEVRPPMRMSQQAFEANYVDQTGLIYLAPTEGGIGHIDLYNKDETGSGYYPASEVWFWQID